MTSVVLVFANPEGGCGKSASTFQLAHALALLLDSVREGTKRILVVDVDPQGGNVTDSFGFVHKTLSRTIYDLLVDREPGLSARDVIIQTRSPGIDILPANGRLEGAAKQLVEFTRRELRLKRILDPLRESYPVIIVDSRAALDALTENAIAAADLLYVPVTPARKGFSSTLAFIEWFDSWKEAAEVETQFEHLIVTRLRRALGTHRDWWDQCQSAFPGKVFPSPIPELVDIQKSAAAEQSIFAYNEKSDAARAYLELARSIVERLGRPHETIGKAATAHV